MNVLSLPTPIKQEIYSYCSWSDKIRIGMVNKQLREETSDDSLYLGEILRCFVDLRSYNYSPKRQWRALCIEYGLMPSNWNNFKFISEEIKQFLFDEIQNVLRSPRHALPPMRKEFHAFPSVVQDLLANPDNPLPTPLPAAKKLNSFIEPYKGALLAEIKDTRNEFFIDFQAKDLVQHDSELFRILSASLRQIEKYCEIFVYLLQGITDDQVLIATYEDRWSYYTYSVEYISCLLKPFTDMIQMDKPLYKYILGLWEENVFKKLENRLFCAFKELLQKERENILGNDDFSRKSAEIMKGFYEGIVDLSLSEKTIFYKNHSRFQGESYLLALNELVVKNSKEFYDRFESYINPGGVSDDLTSLVNKGRFFLKEQRLLAKSMPPFVHQELRDYKTCLIKEQILNSLHKQLITFVPSQDTPFKNKFTGTRVSAGLKEKAGNQNTVDLFIYEKSNTILKELFDIYNKNTRKNKRNKDEDLDAIISIVGAKKLPV